jgi:hypothetical protein
MAGADDVYEVIRTSAELRGLPGWWTVTCNGVPVMHFAPDRKDLAERYAADPEYRASMIDPKLWERAVR